MSRPKPTVLLEYVNKKTYRSEQVLEAEAIWAIFHKGKPFNLKSILEDSVFNQVEYSMVVNGEE